MKVRGHWLRSIAVVVVPIMLVTACGDDDDEGSSTDPPSTEPAATTPAETTPAAETTPPADTDPVESAPADTTAGTEAVAEPSGDPVKVMVLGSFTGPYDTSFSFDAANAAALAINTAGGIQGHPYEILTCDDKFDPNATLDCARQAKDEGAVAIIAGLALTGDYVDYAAQEGIPVIPAVGFNAAEFQNDITFPLTSGAAGYGSAAIAEVIAQGVTKISLVYDDSSGLAKPAAETAAAALEAQGIDVTNVIPMPIDIADAASILAAAEADGAEGAGLLLQGAQVAKFLQSRAQAGSEILVGSYDLSLEPAIIDTLGDAAEGVLMASPFKQLTTVGDPGVDQFLAELAAYDPSMTTDDWSIPGVGLGVYAATHLIAQAAEASPTLDAAGVLATLPTITAFDIGIMAPVDLSTSNTTAVPGFTRLFNTKFYFNRIEGGILVPLGDEPVDVLAAS
jgi:ABC-type branched-subunit amino acid transport system substrate-binding protein